jgi:transposase
VDDRDIHYTDDVTKIEIHEFIKLNKPKFKALHVDRILAEHGHISLHLPFYHLELNAIEKIWAIAKTGWLLRM